MEKQQQQQSIATAEYQEYYAKRFKYSPVTTPTTTMHQNSTAKNNTTDLANQSISSIEGDSNSQHSSTEQTPPSSSNIGNILGNITNNNSKGAVQQQSVKVDFGFCNTNNSNNYYNHQQNQQYNFQAQSASSYHHSQYYQQQQASNIYNNNNHYSSSQRNSIGNSSTESSLNNTENSSPQQQQQTPQQFPSSNQYYQQAAQPTQQTPTTTTTTIPSSANSVSHVTNDESVLSENTESVCNENLSKSLSLKKRRQVPVDQKDSTYWEKRRKNNESAKRSRDMRRNKEEHISYRVIYLEQENLQLRTEVALLRNENEKLRAMLYAANNKNGVNQNQIQNPIQVHQ